MGLLALIGALQLHAHDFSKPAVSTGGDATDSIYYAIISDSPAEVEVTFRGARYNEFSGEYSGEVYIPATVTHGGVTYTVTTIGEDAFYGCSGITALTVPETVDSIVDNFRGLTSLEKLNWQPAQPVKTEYGREWSSSLADTKIEEVRFRHYVPAEMCQNCTTLSLVTFDATMDSIAEGAFRNVPTQFSIEFAPDMERLFIGMEAFHSSWIDSISLPSSITELTVCGLAFADSRLRSFVMPDSVTVVFDYSERRGGGTFNNCDSLREITIPRGTAYLTQNTFTGCDSLKRVTWLASRFYQTSEAGMVIPTREGLTLFKDCPNLESLLIGEDVQVLPSLYAPNETKIKEIDYRAVYATEGTLISMEDNAYINDVTVTFGDRVESIPPRAFHRFSGIKEVTLPASLKSLGCNAFYPTTVINGLTSPMGYTVSIDRNSCSSWDKVYLYARYNDYGTDIEPLGKFPGTEMTALADGLLSYTFPMEFCDNIYIRFSNGTNDNRTRDILMDEDNRIYALPEQTGDNILPFEHRPDGELPSDDGTFLVRLTDIPLPEALTVTLVKPQDEASLWQKAYVHYNTADNNTYTEEMTPAEDGNSFTYTFGIGEELTSIRFLNYTENDGTEYADQRISYVLTKETSYEANGYGEFYPMTCTLQDVAYEQDVIYDDPMTAYSSGVPLSVETTTPDYATSARFSSYDYAAPWGVSVFSISADRLNAAGNNDADGSGWALSPVIDASAAEHLTLSFDHSLSHTDGLTDISPYCNLLVSSDGLKWDTVEIYWPEYGNGVQSGRKASVSVSLDRWKGHQTRIAFAYNWTPEHYPGWTIENLHITSSPVTEQGGDGEIVMVDTDFPQSAEHFYDIDGDGLMEYFSSGSNNDGSTKVYDLYGRFLRTVPITGGLLSVEDVDRSGEPEVIAMDYDYDNPSLTLHSLSGETLAGIYPPDQFYGQKYTQLFDADGDGRMDIYVNYRESVHSIFYQQPDGTFMERRIETVTDPEEISEAMFAQYGANPVIQPPINFSGAALAKAPRPPHMNAPAADAENKVQRAAAAPIFAEDAVTSLDINMDGLPDLLNLYNGNALLSLGDNRYYYGDFGGAVTAKDVSGDGIPDYIVYDEENKEVRLLIYEGNDSFKEQTLMQNFNITGIYCYDFDSDGDVDILLPFDYTSSSGYAFLVFFENQGNNTFKKKEQGVNEKMRFLGCNDYDNDGTYEVIGMTCDTVMTGETDDYSGAPLWRETKEFYLIECNKDFTYTKGGEPDFVLTNTNNQSGDPGDWIFNVEDDNTAIVCGDFNNDGITEFWATFDPGYNGEPYRGTFAAAQPNAAPEKMDAPTFVDDAASGTLRIEWKAGKDATTSACDLSYEIRIGSAPGKGDIWYGHSTADGRRLRPGEGNAAYSLFQIVNTSTWLTGDYYISVQAIDPQGLGSAWSEETVYTKKTLHSALTASPAELTTVDTLTVALSMPYSPAYQYDWDFGEDAVVTSQGETSARVVYTSAGTKTVTLTITDPDGRTATAETSAEVFAVKMESVGNYTRRGMAADFDMDGVLELLGNTQDNNNTLYGLFDNDGKGNFTKVMKTFNSDLEPGETNVILDFNMDGLPDFMTKSNKGNVFVNLEELDFQPDDKTFSFNTADSQWAEDWLLGSGTRWLDINCDGYMDAEHNQDYYLNTGDNLTYTEWSPGISAANQNIAVFEDLNGDGAPDMIVSTYAAQQYSYSLRLNNGDGTFSQPIELETLTRTFSDVQSSLGSGNIKFADFNNDGYKDMLIISNWVNDVPATVILGNAGNTFSETVDLGMEIMIENGDGLTVFDFDNNGYPDLLFNANVGNYKYNTYILYFYQGMQTRLQTVAEGESFSKFEIAGDLNGDGTPDGMSHSISTRHTNTAPAAPANVRAVQDDDLVTLLWDDAIDAETPTTQMRYNVSLRRAGKSGDDSYIVSPLNGGSDEAAPIAGYPYRETTQMSLPIERFTAGEQYELMVQSIDLWGKQSPFSAVYTFEVGSVVAIDAPAETCIESETVITYKGTETGTPEWSLNGATIVTQEGNSITAKWSEAGTKEISVTVGGVTSSRPITVRKSIDMNFSLPELVLAGAEVPFTLPEVFSQAGVSVGVRTSDNQDMSGSSLNFTGNRPQKGGVDNPDDRKIIVERRGSTLDARVTFNTTPGNAAWIELYCVDPVCGEVSYRQSVNLTAENITPEISIVTVDAASGHNKILWEVPSDLPADLFTAMAVYREEGATDNFVEIGRVPVANGEFIDLQSDPTVRKNRYRLALVTSYGGFSTMSEPHSSVHVMLNRGMGSDINIIWTPYEGGTVEQYSIMRGTDAADMTVIATASGYETSYTDKTAAEGVTYYYALSYSNLYESDWRPMNAPAMAGAHYAPAAYASAGMAGQSNVVSTSESKTVTFAQSLSILTLEKLYELSPSVTSLHCYAEIMPAMATYRQVNWSITSGSNLATIDGSGMLTYIGNGENGSVTVKASTMDGSDISETRTISVRGFTKAVPVSSVNVTAPYTTLTPETRMVALSAEVLPTNATDRSVTWSVVSGSAIVSVDLYGNVSARGYNGTATIRATANDGSGAYGEITLTVTGFTGEIVPVESVRIIAPYTELTPENYGSVQLSAEVLPDNATDKTILWEVVSGAELIEISWSGLVRATGTDGTATVRATATDGSGAYDEITLTVSGFGNAVSTAGKERAILWPVPAHDEINVECDYEIARLEVLSLDGRTLITADSTAQIDISSLPAGLYLMRITADNGTIELLRFTVTR